MIVDRLLEVVRDRQSRQRMSEADYWDERAKSRSGHARSVWHAQNFSDVWTKRQESLLDGVFQDLIGTVEGKSLLDVGCGTGRIARFLASRNAKVTGVDFAPVVVEAARMEAKEQGLDIRFEVGNIAQPPTPFDSGTFDAVLSVGCLAVACTNESQLQDSFGELARLVKPYGLVIILEPIHSSRLLGRVLKAPRNAWIEAGQRAGLHLARRQGMGFVPVRLALSSFDLPDWIVEPTFKMGEATLDTFRMAHRLADYSLLCFRKPAEDA